MEEVEDILEKFKQTKTPLKYEKFKKYYKNIKDLGQWNSKQQWMFKFENNYGASVIKHFGSYGFEDDLFELAVIKFYDKDEWGLCYDTEITDDVIGYLTNEEVLELLEQIKGLNKDGRNTN